MFKLISLVLFQLGNIINQFYLEKYYCYEIEVLILNIEILERNGLI